MSQVSDHLKQSLGAARSESGTRLPLFVMEGHGFAHEWKVVQGRYFPLGACSPYYLTRGCASAVNPAVLVCAQPLDTQLDWVVPTLEQLSGQNRALLVVAPQIHADMLQLFVVNHTRQVMVLLAVSGGADSEQGTITELFAEMCGLTAAKCVTTGEPLSVESLGQASRVWVDAQGLLIEQTTSADSTAEPAVIFAVGGSSVEQIQELTRQAPHLVHEGES